MPCIRVDGNDFAAVYAATKEARRIAVDEGRPVLVEAMSYRVGHHSTSDDSSAYRTKDEVSAAKLLSPIGRAFAFLERKGLWDLDQDAALRQAERAAVLKALDAAEKKDKCAVDTLFSDVYSGKLPQHLARQQKELFAHMDKYPGAYKTTSKRFSS